MWKAFLLAALLLPGAVLAQSFDETMSIVVVEVPVSVLKDGKPVHGLGRDDFRIFDGKKEQEILAFEIIDVTRVVPGVSAGPSAPEPAAVPISARRHFLFLFDLLNSQHQSVSEAREAATRMIDELHPTDLVAVGTNSRGGPKLILGFTSDHEQAKVALTSLGLPLLIDLRQDPLSLMIGDLQSGNEQAFGATGMSTDSFDGAQDMARRQESMAAGEQQALIVGQTRALARLAQVMNQIQGRKHVVLLSEGFDSSLLYGTQNISERNTMTMAVSANEIWKVDSEKMFGDTRSINSLQKMIEEFRRANCTIQTVDIGGIDHHADVQAGSTRAVNADRATIAAREETLATIAEETGGKLYKNTNNLAVAMSDMLEATGVTYLLAYQPQKIRLDGKYHRIKVELKNKEHGVELVHRPGYYAPKPFEELDVGERQLLTAQHILGGDENQAFIVEAMATAMAGVGETSYVPVLVEIDGASLAATENSDVLRLEIFAYAFDSGGRVRDFLHQEMGFDLGQGRSSLQAGGLKFYGDLELPPGDYSLRVYVRNAANGTYSLRNLALRVPAASAEPRMLQPFFVDPANKWLLVRENKKADEETEYPFHVKGESFVPAVLPVVRAGEPTPLKLIAYDFGGNPLSFTSRVLTTEGREMAGASVEGIERSSDAARIDRFSSILRLDALEPGEYRLEVTLIDQVTGERASSWTRFDVAGP